VTQLEVMPQPPEKENKALVWPDWPLKMRTSSSHEEGVERDFAVLTKRAVGEDGRITALECARIDWVKGDDGRLAMREVEGSRFELKADLVLLAMGFLGPRKFSDGDEVKKDQILFTIEPEPYQAAVDQKIAQRDSAQAALNNAELQLKRAAELLRTNTGTQVTYDQRLSEQLQAKAQLEDANAQLRDAQIQLSYTEIKSPIDGRIGRASVSPGNIVGPDSGVLATVVKENPIRVLFPVTQRELLEARRDNSVGDPPNVRVRLADGSFFKEKGKLDFIDVARHTPFDPDLFVDAIHTTYAGERVRAWVFFQLLVPIVESHLKSGAWPRKVAPSTEPPPGSRSPPRIRMKVDLPQPFAPMRP